MSSLYGITKRTYPLLYMSGSDVVFIAACRHGSNRVRTSVIRRLERSAAHDEIYDKTYYQSKVEPLMGISAQAIAGTIWEAFSPHSVVDVGCGTGLLNSELQKSGAKCLGLEYSQAGIEFCQSRGLKVLQFDIERDEPPAINAQVIVCTEAPSTCQPRVRIDWWTFCAEFPSSGSSSRLPFPDRMEMTTRTNTPTSIG